jgi:glutaredoxin-like protein NrdH
MLTVTVTVYSKPNCQACNLTKSHLAKLEIAFSEEPIDDEVREAALELDLLSAPIVCANVDGVELEPWSGFRPDRISALVGAAA